MWLTKEDTVYIKGFDIIRKDRWDCTGGGIAIVKNGLKYQRMKNLCNCKGKLEVCAISAFVSEVKTLLVRQIRQTYL
jgi:hypothetical protein